MVGASTSRYSRSYTKRYTVNERALYFNPSTVLDQNVGELSADLEGVSLGGGYGMWVVRWGGCVIPG